MSARRPASASTPAGTSNNKLNGGTIISNGTLLVNGTLPAGVALTNAAGTLGGTGIVYSAVVVTNAATLAPGVSSSSGGTLTVSNLTLSATCTNAFDLGAVGSSDKVVVNGTTFVWGGVHSISALAGFGAGTYDLFTYAGTITTNGTPAALLPQSYKGALKVVPGSPGKVELIVAAGGRGATVTIR